MAAATIIGAIISAVIGVIISAVTTSITVRRQNQIARQQFAQVTRQHEFRNNEILRKLQQEEDATEERAAIVARDQAESVGAIKALQGVGVSARSVEALRAATLLQSRTNLARIQRQESFARADAAAGYDINALNTEALYLKVDRPSWAAAGLQIGASALEGAASVGGAYAEYKYGGTP